VNGQFMLLPLCSRLSAHPGWGFTLSHTLFNYALQPTLTGESWSQTLLYWFGCSGSGSVVYALQPTLTGESWSQTLLYWFGCSGSGSVFCALQSTLIGES